MYKKLFAYFRINLAEAIQYNFRGFVWTWTDILPSIAVIYFWNKAFETQAIIKGQTRGDLIGYFIVSGIVLALLTSHPEFGLSENINKGAINHFLLRPMSVLRYYFMGEIAYKVNRLRFMIPSLFVLYLISLQVLSHPLKIFFSPLILFVLVNCFIIIFLIKFLIGLSAFWFSEIGWIASITETLTLLLAGILLPIYFFPSWFQTLSSWLPFQFFLYVPVQLILGRLDVSISNIILSQLIWMSVLFFLCQFVWKKGLKVYVAYGG